MGLLKIAVIVGVVAGVVYLFGFGKDPVKPEIKDGWFGRGKQKPDDTSVKEFKVNVPESVLTDLKLRLENARLGEDLENNDNFHYGFNVATMKDVLEHWRTKYDWRKHEKILNEFPQYKTQIEGLDVHFLRVKPKTKGPHRVLLLLHGWPQTIWEFHKILPILTEPEKHGGLESDAFEVICPSIPGFGFSESPHQTGFSTDSASRIFVKLMKRLGHTEFYLQGGDFGGIISTQISIMFPSNVLGVHLNFYLARMSPLLIVKHVFAYVFPSVFFTERERRLLTPVSEWFTHSLREMGYLHLQATKPDTIGAALMDTPMGLAAYILEKYSTGTRDNHRELPDGGLTRFYTLDELLTNIMIFWLNGNFVSSARWYREFYTNEAPQQWEKFEVTVPSGLCVFPDEFIVTAEYQARDRFTDIVQFTDMPRGGHFAALEEPALLANDIKSFVRKVEQRTNQGK